MTRKRPPNRGRPAKTSSGATRLININTQKSSMLPGIRRLKKLSIKRLLIKVKRFLNKLSHKFFNF